jgi:hypothetical protein
MKNLKTTYGKLFAMFVLIAGVAFMQSCSKDDEKTTVDKTALLTKITDSNALIADAEEGTASGQYAKGSIATFQAVIDIAQTVYDDDASTQVVVDNSVSSLTSAMTAFEAAVIVPIAPESLVAHWAFDDATGTTVKDYSENAFDGTFGNEAGFGNGQAAWTTDRYGNAGKALAFDLGAKVTVPYNVALNPGQMTVALWINAAEVRENNRFMGLHSWLGYKFQLQSGNKAYFTGCVDPVGGTYIEDDTDPELDLDTWYHIAVTVGAGKLIFYVNGVETRNLDVANAELVKDASHDLVFGVGSSQYADVDTNYDTDKIIPIAWGGYFHGSLDEVRMYNVPLTASQIKSIYDLEKVTE